jgi:hypothetical protein
MAQSPHRLERTFGPRLTLKEANLLCWGLFFALLVPAVYRAIETQRGDGPDADFVNFFAMGRILNEYPAASLYDTGLQKQVRDAIHPLRTGAYAPVPYPPFVGIFFQPFARLSYVAAYRLWVCLSLILYLAGLALVTGRLFPGQRARLALIVCLSLAFFPFTIETLVNCQLSSVAFLAIAAAFLLEDSRRCFLSGLALSLCAYKPTLIPLLIPMLLVTRRFRVIAGFAAGAAVIALVTTLRLGLSIWPAYTDLLFHFGRGAAGAQPGFKLNFSKYVDFTAFSALLPGGRSRLALAMLAAFVIWAVVALIRAWWSAAASGRPAMRMVWASTITWTLLLNLYVPIYDSILLVLSALIWTGAMQEAQGTPQRHALALLWPAVFVCAWFTISAADTWSIQILTLLIAAVGVLQLRVCRASITSIDPRRDHEGALAR